MPPVWRRHCWNAGVPISQLGTEPAKPTRCNRTAMKDRVPTRPVWSAAGGSEGSSLESASRAGASLPNTTPFRYRLTVPFRGQLGESIVTKPAAPLDVTADYREDSPAAAPSDRVRVALVAGSGEAATDDLYRLLRRRLLILSSIVAGGLL